MSKCSINAVGINTVKQLFPEKFIRDVNLLLCIMNFQGKYNEVFPNLFYHVILLFSPGTSFVTTVPSNTIWKTVIQAFGLIFKGKLDPESEFFK